MQILHKYCNPASRPPTCSAYDAVLILPVVYNVSKIGSTKILTLKYSYMQTE